MIEQLKRIRQKFAGISASLINVFRWMYAPRHYPLPFVPVKWLRSYTMNGKIRIKFYYLIDVNLYRKERVYKKHNVDLLLDKIRNRETFYYGKTDLWLYQALEKFPIKDKEVAVMGSTSPLYESICIFFGGKPTTIEYNKIVSEDSRLKVMTVDDYDRSPIKFDSAFSISSFEHDGLGRYGDRLNPDGDLLAMTKMKSILKPGGILFLTVPTGRDMLVWNAHRIYGKIRLPLLLKGWELLGTFGFSDDLLNKITDEQPIFVLKNT